MDQILELFDKYRCHLKRESMNSADFLESNFQCYIDDVKKSIDIKGNPTVGKKMCEMIDDCIDEIEENAYKIVDVLRLYENGKIVQASVKAFNVFNIMKPQLMQRYSGDPQRGYYYRIRRYDESNPFKLHRKALFHISHKENYLVGTERYSMPGHPCLYLASQPELAWYECGKPAKFALAKFNILKNNEEYLKCIDFSEHIMPLMVNFTNWFHNEKDDRDLIQKYLLKYIYTYPLRAACSLIVEHPKNPFIEEYIIPQLLLQWVCNDEDIDGIRYESCSNSNIVNRMGGYNLVLITKQFDAEGYDVKLRNCIEVGEPELFDIDKLCKDENLLKVAKGIDISTEPFLWRMKNVSSNFRLI